MSHFQPTATPPSVHQAQGGAALQHVGLKYGQYVPFTWRCVCDHVNAALAELDDNDGLDICTIVDRCWHCEREPTESEHCDFAELIDKLLEDRAADEADNV